MELVVDGAQRFASDQSRHQLFYSNCTYPAWNALAAGLVAEESRESREYRPKIGVVVEHHYHAGPESRACSTDPLE
jgi:hypothetical protein